MRLAPGGGQVSRHADITDPDAGASEGKVVCIHIPLISNDRSVWRSWGLDGNTSSIVMRPGTAAYLDVRKPHTAVNMGDTPPFDEEGRRPADADKGSCIHHTTSIS